MRNLSNFSDGTPNVHFSGFNFMRYFRDQVIPDSTLYDHIINIRLDISIELWLKNELNTMLVSDILKAFLHS